MTETSAPGDVLAEYRDRARVRRRESDNDGFGVMVESAVRDARELEGARRRGYFPTKPM